MFLTPGTSAKGKNPTQKGKKKQTKVPHMFVRILLPNNKPNGLSYAVGRIISVHFFPHQTDKTDTACSVHPADSI